MCIRDRTHVADGVAFLEDPEGNGSVFLWGMAAWCWRAGDPAGRRLAAVQLVNSKAARQRQVADAFGVHENSLVRWRASYGTGGVGSLVTERPGPKGPSKLTDAKREEIRSLRASGLSLAEVAARTGVSTFTVRRATVVAPDVEPSGDLADARTGEDDGADERTQRVERCVACPVDARGDLDQAGGGQGGQDEQSAGQRKRGPFTDHRRASSMSPN